MSSLIRMQRHLSHVAIWHIFVFSAAVLTQVLLLNAWGRGLLTTNDDAAATWIRRAYALQDTAFGKQEVEDYVRYIHDPITMRDDKGQGRVLRKAEIIENARRSLRDLPGNRLVRRQVTTISDIRVHDGDATVRGSVIQELLGSDSVGTVIDVRQSLLFQDSWHKTNSGWLIVAGQQLTAPERTSRVQPSPAIVDQLKAMRDTADILRGFNQANNYSTCMTSNGNQKYDYETRKSFCSP